MISDDDTMRYLGRIERITRDGLCLGKIEEKDNLLKVQGRQAFNNRERKIGYIKEIIGPIRNPFFLLKVSRSEKRPFDLLNTDVYVGEKNGKTR